MKKIYKGVSILAVLSLLGGCPSPSTNPDPSQSPTPTVSPAQSTTPTSEPSSTPTVMPSSVMPTNAPVMNDNPPISTLPNLVDGYRLSVNGSVFNGAGNKILNERIENTSASDGYMRLSSVGFERVGDSSYEYDFKLTIRPGNTLPLPALTFTEADFSGAELEVNMINKKTKETYNFTSYSLTGRDRSIPVNFLNNSDAVNKRSTVIFSNNGDKTRYYGYVDTIVSSKSNNSPLQNMKVRLEFNYLLVQKSNR